VPALAVNDRDRRRPHLRTFIDRRCPLGRRRHLDQEGSPRPTCSRKLQHQTRDLKVLDACIHGWPGTTTLNEARSATLQARGNGLEPCWLEAIQTIFRGPPSRQLSISASLSFSLIRGRSLGFTIGCHACNGHPAVWSEHRRTVEGQTWKAGTVPGSFCTWGPADEANLQQQTAATKAQPGGGGCDYSRLARHE
jgi:hypothetical protein